MTIVPIHRRGANVAHGGTVLRRTDSGVQRTGAPPDRVPILMRMPDLARVDEPESAVSTAAGPTPDTTDSRPTRTTKPNAAPAAPRGMRIDSPTPRDTRTKDVDTPKAKSVNRDTLADTAPGTTMTPERLSKVRARNYRSTGERRRDMPGRQKPTAGAWMQPSYLLIGAAILAVIVSIVAMIRRPAVQQIETLPPGWNAGGAPTTASPVSAVPLNPSPAVAAPVSAVPINNPPVGPAPVSAAPINMAPAPTAVDNAPQPGAWPAPAPSDAPLLLPEPTAQRSVPGQLLGAGSPALANGQRSAGGNGLAPTATLMGTIDKPEQPTILRAEHERTGQGVY